jgi:hypothetical protein
MRVLLSVPRQQAKAIKPRIGLITESQLSRTTLVSILQQRMKLP